MDNHWFLTLDRFLTLDSFLKLGLLDDLYDSVFLEVDSNVLLIGDLMKQAQRLVQEQVHPRIITEGYELARK